MLRSSAMFHSVEIGQASGLAPRGDRSRDQAFSAFVSSDSDLVGLVAFALHERQFEEWRAEMARACGRPPTQDEIHAHRLGETTPRRIAAYRFLAQESLQGRGSHKSARAAYCDAPEFELFCASEYDFVGMVAYAIHEQQAREWREAVRGAYGRAPTSDEERAHRVSETSPRRILAYRFLAGERLAGRGPDLTPGVSKVSFIVRALGREARSREGKSRLWRNWGFRFGRA
ncbi:MAG: hypothetical protein U1E30_12415 [Rhodoblastus sp.]